MNPRRSSRTKIPELDKLYTVGTVSQRTIQISHYLSLIHHVFSGSKQRSFMNQTLNHSYMFISSPFQNLITSESSAVRDLPNHVHETSKGEDENFTYLEWQCFNRVFQASTNSRSAPIWLIRSFEHKSSIETNQIQLNLKLPLTCSCIQSSVKPAQMPRMVNASCSKLFHDHESMKKLCVCGKNFEIWRERKIEGKMNFQI